MLLKDHVLARPYSEVSIECVRAYFFIRTDRSLGFTEAYLINQMIVVD
jgi:hypothetical protein